MEKKMSIRVHLADDHALFRSGLKVLLEKESDIEVIGETGDGFETVKAVAELDLDILLLDLSMPGMSGPQVAEIAIENKPHLSIIVLTMHEDEYYLQELFRIGVKAFILKKSSGTALIQSIRSVYRGDHYIDPALADKVISPYVGKPSKKTKGRVGLLTQREQEICRHLAYGHTSTEIADILSISPRTVDTHRGNIMSKLDLNNRAELVRFAIDNGLMKTG
jgi:two-component system, NarL family, response regulator NreC